MISCQLGDKKYTVNTVTGRALREIGPASDMYVRLSKIGQNAENGTENADDLKIGDALDVMVQWFCVLFQNQFTIDEFYDNYPADQIISDVALAVLAVQNAASNILSTFPTTPTTEAPTPKRTARSKKA